ncbi:Rho guanine nucleotide exchange factor [Marasmius tenuissimus]|nr:Rho guanine nucleotide exchange factor [Marasmius tenuissimus]
MPFQKIYSSLRSRTPEGPNDMRLVVQAIINDRDRDRYKRLLKARGDEAQQYLDALQVLAESPDVEVKLRSSISRMMLHLSKRSGLCPNYLNIKNVKRAGAHSVGDGGFGDVWKLKVDDRLVCLKVVKVCIVSDAQKLLKEYMREAIIWQQLHHPNLLPFVGMYHFDKAREQSCLLSPWMNRGDLIQYLKDTPRERVDHRALAYDVASGVAHLHSTKVVHGDLKSFNVLMTPEERACIGDFGLSQVADTHSLRLSETSTGQGRGTTRWLAPELLRSDPPSSVSVRSDIYAYACVCYEIFTGGNVPFHGLNEGAGTIAVAFDKKHPSRPRGVRELTNEMWEIMVACGNHSSQCRPAAGDVRPRVALCSPKTRLQVQSYPAPEWDARSLTQIWKNVKYPQVDTTAADDRTSVVVDGAKDAKVHIQNKSPPPLVDIGRKQERPLNVAPGMLLPVPTPIPGRHHGSVDLSTALGFEADKSAAVLPVVDTGTAGIMNEGGFVKRKEDGKTKRPPQAVGRTHRPMVRPHDKELENEDPTRDSQVKDRRSFTRRSMAILGGKVLKQDRTKLSSPTAPLKIRSKSDGNIPEETRVHALENVTRGSIWKRLTTWKNAPSDGVDPQRPVPSGLANPDTGLNHVRKPGTYVIGPLNKVHMLIPVQAPPIVARITVTREFSYS